MKYSIDYQYLTKGSLRPLDHGEVVGIQTDENSRVVLLPNVGDYVAINNHSCPRGRESFSGKVKSKLFNYFRMPGDEIYCHVNIVIEETDGSEWPALIKE